METVTARATVMPAGLAVFRLFDPKSHEEEIRGHSTIKKHKEHKQSF
jgi:hypothetical protein